MINRSFPEIKGEITGSWAHFTLTERIPSIIDKVLAVNQFSQPCQQAFEALKREIPGQEIYLPPDIDPENELDQAWKSLIDQTGAKNWLEVSFYWAESYFYFRVHKIIEKYHPGIDPFAPIKYEDVQKNLDFIKKLVEFSESGDNLLTVIVQFTLWGNQADLSQLHWDQKKPADLEEVKGKLGEKLLVDHSEHLLDQLKSADRIDLVLDNAGLELFTDLLLADYILRHKQVQEIHLHFKPYPTFVSDALEADFWFLISTLDQAGASGFAQRWRNYYDQEQVKFKKELFWNLPLYLFEPDSDLFAGTDLVIAKGDANYRRILGDFQVPADFPVNKLAGYLDHPCFAIRTPKSELMAGLDSEIVNKVSSKDPEWMVNGQWGMIQYCNGVTKSMVL